MPVPTTEPPVRIDHGGQVSKRATSLLSDRSAVDASPFSTLLFTPDLILLDANAAHVAMAGVTPQAMHGRSMFEVWPKSPDHDGPDTEDVIRASVARIMASNTPDEVPIQRHDLPLEDGTFEHRYWRMIHSPIRDGDGTIVAVRQDSWDVTESVRAEERSRTLQRAAQTIAGMAFWEVDVETGRMTGSQELEAMFGFARGETGGDLSRFHERVHPEDMDELQAATGAMVEGPSGVAQQMEYRVVLPDNSLRYLLVRGEKTAGVDGSQTIVGTTLDMTPLRQHETDLKAALAQKDALLGEVNHRVKNSLQLVSSILAIGARGETDASAKAKLLSAADRVQSVAAVHSALYHSDDVRFVAFGAHLRNFVARLATSAGADERGIAVSVDAIEVALRTERAVALSLIVNELLTNSLKYAFLDDAMPGTPHVRVTLSHHEHGKLVLRVADNGRGGSDLPRAVENARTDATGLGSRLIASLAAQIKGEVETIRENGWTTTIVFPE